MSTIVVTTFENMLRAEWLRWKRELNCNCSDEGRWRCNSRGTYAPCACRCHRHNDTTKKGGS